MRQVLVIDDDRAVRDALVQTLELADCRVISTGSFVAAKDYISPDFEGIILSDIRIIQFVDRPKMLNDIMKANKYEEKYKNYLI